MKMRVGMNLASNVYYRDDLPFADFVKSSGDWDKPALVLSRDANDWPTAIGGQVSCMVPMTDKPRPFIIRWKGQGDFKLSRNFKPADRGEGWLKVVSASLESPNSEVPANALTITKLDGTDPLRDITIVPAEYDERHRAGLVTNPEFTSKLRGYGDIRFMDWMRTNEQSPATTMSQRSWFWGVPLPACLLTAEAAGARAWINIPAWADDNYVANIGKAVPEETRIEDVNEEWNIGFLIGAQLAAEAKAAGVDKGVHIARRQMNRARLLESVGRRLVVGYQPTTKSTGWAKFNAELLALGASKRNVSAVMTTCYPTGGVNSIAGLTPYMQRGDTAGVVALLRADVIANSALRYAVAGELADELGVPKVVYEGNTGHLNSSAGLNTAVDFVDRVHDDPGNYDLGTIMLDIADKAGVETFNVFNNSSEATRKGCFGVWGRPFGRLLDEIRTAPPPAPRSTDDRLARIEERLTALDGLSS